MADAIDTNVRMQRFRDWASLHPRGGGALADIASDPMYVEVWVGGLERRGSRIWSVVAANEHAGSSHPLDR